LRQRECIEQRGRRVVDDRGGDVDGKGQQPRIGYVQIAAITKEGNRAIADDVEGASAQMFDGEIAGADVLRHVENVVEDVPVVVEEGRLKHGSPRAAILVQCIQEEVTVDPVGGDGTGREFAYSVAAGDGCQAVTRLEGVA